MTCNYLGANPGIIREINGYYKVGNFSKGQSFRNLCAICVKVNMVFDRNCGDDDKIAIILIVFVNFSMPLCLVFIKI